MSIAGSAGCGDDSPVAIGAALSSGFVDAARMAIADREPGGPSLDTLLIGEATNRAAPALEMADRFRQSPGMVAVVAHSNSASSLATAPVYNAAGIVQLAPTSTAPSYSEAGPFSFRLVPSDDAQGITLARAIDSLFPDGARVAVLYVNDDYGRGIRGALRSRLDSARFPVVHDQPHSDEEVTLPATARAQRVASMVESLVASAPETIVWLGRARTFLPHLRQIRTSLGAIPVFGADALSSWGAWDDGTGLWGGVRYTDFLDPTGSRELRDFRDRYRERTGAEAGTGEILSYDAMALLLAAIRDGARTGEAVRAWLHDLGRSRPVFPGVSGPIAFDDAGDVQRPHVLLTIPSSGP